MAEGGAGRRLRAQLPKEEGSTRPTTTPVMAAGYSWEKFSHWVACACVVTFDLELGQAMEV